MSEGISVKDRLPEAYRPCIVFMELKPGKTGLFYEFAFLSGGLSTRDWGRAPDFKALRGIVTHWMPFPERPEASL